MNIFIYSNSFVCIILVLCYLSLLYHLLSACMLCHCPDVNP